MGRKREIHPVSSDKPEGKRPFRKPRHEWQNNIRPDFKQIRFESVDWSRLNRYTEKGKTVVNTAEQLLAFQKRLSYMKKFSYI